MIVKRVVFFRKIVSLYEFFSLRFVLNDELAGNFIEDKVDEMKKNMVLLTQQTELSFT